MMFVELAYNDKGSILGDLLGNIVEKSSDQVKQYEDSIFNFYLPTTDPPEGYSHWNKFISVEYALSVEAVFDPRAKMWYVRKEN